ncbi:selenide water dikinase, putative [Plasmodium sp. gorilla clade G3]|nr:selenide water dikinase, putative [Plasmodium sp. gorilla clade G3]
MRICKRIDPVIDIVIVGFGMSSKRFVDIFLLNNELKGVNITIISKNTFVFLDRYVQCIELCKDSYIDIYKYCKERNILFINEQVESIDSDKKIIKFSSDRNHLCYDYLLCDFDYKSSYLMNNNDLSHMNIYTYKDKNLFFYYTHIIYLSLIKSQNNKKTDKKEYMKWKTFFLKNISLEKFYNFCSYNDKYVENIIDIYNFFDILLNNNMPYYDFKVVQEKVKILNILKNKNPLIKEIVKNENYNFHLSGNEKDETKQINNTSDNIFQFLILCDENNYNFGKNLYYEIFENLHKISITVKVIYVHIINEEKYNIKDDINDTINNNNNIYNNNNNNMKCSGFCSHFVQVREIKQVKQTEDKFFIEYMDMNNKLSTIFFDECINITNLKYPSYIYKSGYDIDNNKNINNFCQYYNDESLYFLNQITNYDTYTICQNVYINIYNNIHKKDYISIDNVKDHMDIYNLKQKHISMEHFSIYHIYEILINSYNKIIKIIKFNLIYIIKHPLTQNRVKPFLINKKYLIDNYLNEKKKKIKIIERKSKSSSIDLFINLIMYIYNKFLYYISHFENIIFHTKHVKHIPNINNNSKQKINCNIKNIGNTNQNTELLPAYMYDEYKKEYENRLIIKKKTSYKLVQNNNSIELYEDNNKNDHVKGTDDPYVIVEHNNFRKEPILDTSNNKKVQSYIKESIDKIINRNTCGGCGSKVPSNVLSNSLKSLDIFNSQNVYLGVEGSDDCCIFVHSKSKTTKDSPALVQTIDFFKSFIDDEYILGSIIAIHSLSDIYSMGGTGICALCVLIVKDNIERKLQQRLENVLTGCCQKLKEEKCVLSGGHTCAGNENYVGLAVTGKIKKRKEKNSQQQNGNKNIMNFEQDKNENKNNSHIQQLINEDNINNIESKEDENKLNKEINSYIEKHQMLKENYLFLPKGNGNIKNGDVIITTKMFGFGFIMAAHIIKKAKARWIYSCLDEMLISNRKSGLYFLQNNVKACTDVTGFGILGHLNEMLKCSRKEIYLHYKKTNNKHNANLDETTKHSYNKNQDEQIKQNKKLNMCDQNNKKLNMLGAKIKLNNIIIAEGVQECIENNIYSSMYKKNHYLCNNIINLDEAQLYSKYGILFDPQTSGGLMAIVEREKASQILYDLKNMGYPNSSIIGEIINVQYEKFNNKSIQDISLSDYLDTTDSIYVEL